MYFESTAKETEIVEQANGERSRGSAFFFYIKNEIKYSHVSINSEKGTGIIYTHHLTNTKNKFVIIVI